jgi:hypothetical protein
MIATTFEGEPVCLLPYRPDWSVEPKVKFEFEVAIQQALQAREVRLGFHKVSRIQCDFNFYLDRTEQAAFRLALQALENKRVLCPFWPAAHAHYAGGGSVYTAPDGSFYTAPDGSYYTTGSSATPPFSTGIWLTFEPDFSAWEIHTTETPTGYNPTPIAIRVPLMLGHFDEPPSPGADTPGLLSVDIAFRDTASVGYALRPATQALASGLTLPNGRTPSVFPLRSTWSRKPQAGGAVVDIERRDIGYGRTPAEAYYPQPSARPFTYGFQATSWEECARLASFFEQVQGSVQNFWLEGVMEETRLASPATSGSATITVESAAALGDNTYIAAITSYDAAPIHRKILSKNLGANTLTLDAPLGDFAPGSVRIVALVLARFKKAELEMSFVKPGYAETQIAFIETPTEYDVIAGETNGIDHGGQATPAFLFRFHRKYPGGTITDRMTSYERPVVLAGEVFPKKAIESFDIIDSLNPEKTTVKIESRAFDANPLMLFSPNRLEGRLYIEILECTPDADGNAGTAEIRFVGTVDAPKIKGPFISTQATHLLKELSRSVPTALRSRMCTRKLFGGPCGLAIAAWTFTANASSATGNNLALGGLAKAGGLPAIPAGYFKLGQVWVGSGATYQIRSIFDSTAESSGAVTLTLGRPFNGTLSGTIYLVPGCDQTPESCKTKFNNYARFGGQPYTPNGNPTFLKIAEPAGGGKK